MQRIGRYRVLETVGRGASGTVHRALDPSGREVAVKQLLVGKEATPLQRRRFGTELQALLRIRHEHVVQLLDAGEEGDHPFLVMEWIPGETLAARLDRLGPLPAQEAATLVCKLAGALEACHREGVLHRDLKPGNVLLRPNGQPVLTDFGLAKDLEASQGGSSGAASLRGRMLGTPGYWPPEQAMGELEQIGTHSDVYGLGALLFACLTACPPHEGQSLVELLTAFEQPPRLPSAVQPGVPRGLDDVCTRCLARDPGDRYPHPGLVEQDLRTWLASAATPARVTPATPHAPSSPVHGPLARWVPILLGAPLVGLAIGYVGLRQSLPAPDDLPAGSPEPAVPELPPSARFLAALDAAAACAADPPAWRRGMEAALPLSAAALEVCRSSDERARLLVRRGECLWRLQWPVEAASDWEEAVALDPVGSAGAEAMHLLLQHSPGDERLLARAALRARTSPAPWSALLDAEVAWLRDRDHAAALGRTQAGLAQDGSCPALNLFHGRLLLLSDDGVAAEAAIRRAVDVDGGDANAWRALAEACEVRADWSGASAAIARAMALAPGDSGLLWQRARLQALCGNDGLLPDALARVLEARPDQDTLREVAWLAQEQGALSTVQRALFLLEQRYGSDPTPALVRSFQRLREGQGEQAVEELLAAAARATSHSKLEAWLLTRAVDLALLGPAAIDRRAQALLALDPKDPTGTWLAVVADLVRDRPRGTTRLREALSADPLDRRLREAELVLLRGSEEYERALQRFEKDLGNDPVALGLLASCRLQQRQASEAERVIRRALELDPRCAMALGAAAAAAGARGDVREMGRLAAAALASAPYADPEYLQMLGVAEAQLGRRRTGVELCRRALRLSPVNSDITAWLMRTLASAGRLEEAREVYQEHGQMLQAAGAGVMPQVVSTMAELLLGGGDLPGARRLLEELVGRHAEPDYLALLAETCRRQDQPDRARELAERALAQAPSHARAKEVLGLLPAAKASTGTPAEAGR